MKKKQKLEELKNEFNLLHSETDRQKAGYGIEKIVEEMFLNEDIDYHPLIELLHNKLMDTFILRGLTIWLKSNGRVLNRTVLKLQH